MKTLWVLMGCVRDSAASYLRGSFWNMWIEPDLCCTRAVVLSNCGAVDPFENLVKIVCMCIFFILLLEVCGPSETRGLKGFMMTEKPGQIFNHLVIAAVKTNLAAGEQVDERIQKQEYQLSIRNSDCVCMEQRFSAGWLDEGCSLLRYRIRSRSWRFISSWTAPLVSFVMGHPFKENVH